MNSPSFGFEVLHQDQRSAARRSLLTTRRGTVQCPTFMPVGTQGTVKGLTIDQVLATGAEMVLGNTYHLALRPSVAVVQQLGGLHTMMGWQGPILTDSGGFQLYSLAQRVEVAEEGVVFRSHVDGSPLEMTPESCMQLQRELGSDIAMVLDHVVALPTEADLVQEACERSVRWAARCQASMDPHEQTQFAIVQGGLDQSLRRWCTEQLVGLDFPGFAVGGLSVGETAEQMYRVLDMVEPILPADRPRYLMGVGKPQDILEAVQRGIDMFDCVMPTRNGRNALAFTDTGAIRLRNRQYQRSSEPLEANCPCLACRHSRGYLRHLFMAGEMLGPVLVSIHNLTYYQRLMADIRTAIEADRLVELAKEKYQGWG
ncbi:MAG: tRNA guanosine(34) transglycosylase Tgt [Pirellulaceae bacterium]